jgi:hypothetical protein
MSAARPHARAPAANARKKPCQGVSAYLAVAAGESRSDILVLHDHAQVRRAATRCRALQPLQTRRKPRWTAKQVSFLRTRSSQTPKRNPNVTLASLNRSKRQDDG